MLKWKTGSKKQFNVVINNVSSCIKSLDNGGPWGTVVLFIIAFNEIIKMNIDEYRYVEHSLYADDIIIYTKVFEVDKIKKIFTDILNDLTLWSTSSSARISYDKCNILHICRKTCSKNFSFSYNNINIKVIPTLKILGIIFDCKFIYYLSLIVLHLVKN